MLWSTINFFHLVHFMLPSFSRKNRFLDFLNAIIQPIITIYESTIYSMQHDGRTIYLEKLLNEYYKVVGYNANFHETTKKIYIEDIPSKAKIYIYQPEENQPLFINNENENSVDDVFIDNENENSFSYSWIIKIPITQVFEEIQLRAFVDKYRYIGKKYIIETY